MVIAILAILALCVIRAAGSATERADVVKCVGNLRSLHMALVTDTTELGHWPQCPYEVGDPSFDIWWMNELTRYKISRQGWICPTLMRVDRTSLQDLETGKPKIHYIPTNFDDNPATPRKWATQPWLVEIADSHGEGNLMVFPDGAIMGSTRYLNQHR